MEKDEIKMIWRNYFEDLYNMDTQEQVLGHMWGFDDIQICLRTEWLERW